MYLKNLKLVNFRNFSELNLEFPDECIVFEGKNGIGKTNLLESIYLLSTGKSQRKAKRSDIISFDSSFFFVEGIFHYANDTSVTVGAGSDKNRTSSFLINGEPVTTFSDWFGDRPVISFDSSDIFLVTGPPENKRRFLDFFGSFYYQEYVQLLFEYRYWLHLRNRLLTSSYNKIQCELYEEKMVHFGSKIMEKRYTFIRLLSEQINSIYCAISGENDCVKIAYKTSFNVLNYSKNSWKNVFYDSLSEFREKDKSIGYTSIGPHRDTFSVTLNGNDARLFGSQGQCRSLSLSLKLSSSLCLEQKFGENVIFIVDDILSELDSDRTGNFFSLIRKRGQVFLATPKGKVTVSEDFHFIDITSLL